MDSDSPAASAGGISALDLLATSATPTIVLVLLSGVGAAMSRKGVLGAEGCQVLAQMCFFCFTPALTFGKVVQAVSLPAVARLWPLLATMTLNVLLGLAHGAALARALRTPRLYRTHVLVSVSMSNVGNLPLLFVTTLCHDRRAVFYRTLGDSCERLGVAYTAFNIAAATLWQFTLAINLLRRGRDAAAAAGALDGASAAADLADTAANGDADGAPGCGAGNRQSGIEVVEAAADARRMQKLPTLSDLLKGERGGRGRGGSAGGSGGSTPRGECATLALTPVQHQQQQQQQQLQQQQQQSVLVELQPAPGPAAALQHGGRSPSHAASWQQVQRGGLNSGTDAAAAADDDSAALLPGGGERGSKSGGAVEAGSGSGMARWAAAAARKLRAADWAALFPLPTQAAVFGIICGCTPPVKALLYGPRPPLGLLAEVLDALGAGLIPAAIPLLGAVLYRSVGRPSRLPRRVTLGVLCAKLVVQPALMTLLVVGALAARLFTPPDAMFLFTLLLSNATPTAINMQTLTVLYRFGEAEMSSLLYWQYLASVLTLPAFIALFLRIIAVWVEPAA